MKIQIRSFSPHLKSVPVFTFGRYPDQQPSGPGALSAVPQQPHPVAAGSAEEAQTFPDELILFSYSGDQLSRQLA